MDMYGYRKQVTKTEYNRVHQNRLRQYPKSGICEFCNALVKTQWANKSAEYRDAHDTFDWLELCIACHVIYDKKTPAEKDKGYTKLGRPIKPENLARLRSYAWYKD